MTESVTEPPFSRLKFPPKPAHLGPYIPQVISETLTKSRNHQSSSLQRNLHLSAMANSIGPGKFYGNSLPRPWYYTDVKLNSDRVDPPASFLDPLLSWANEAHWSMGGLNFQRLRLQGRIEGSVKKLKAEKENDEKCVGEKKVEYSPSPPPHLISKKRKRFITFIDEDEDEISSKNQVDSVEIRVNCRSSRKIMDEFDRVATDDLTKMKSKTGNLDDDADLVEIKDGLTKNKMMKSASNLIGRSNNCNAVQDVKGSIVNKGKIRTSPRLSKNIAR